MESMESLHDVIMRAKSGCEISRWEVYRRYMPFIEKKLNEVWLTVENIEALLEECDRQIGIAIKEYSPKKAKKRGVSKIIERNLRRAVGSYKKMWENKRRGYEIVAEEEIDIDLAVDGYSTEEVVIAKEEEIETIKKFASLARGDDKKKRIVLKGWLEGLNDSEIARVLAHRCGSSFEANRKFIHRFRNRCRQAYSA